MHLLAYTAVHCTVEEARERFSYDEVMSGGWFLLELEKAKNGDKKAFRPDPEDQWREVQRLMKTNPELFN